MRPNYRFTRWHSEMLPWFPSCKQTHFTITKLGKQLSTSTSELNHCCTLAVLESIYGNEYTRVTIMVCYYVTGQNYPYPFILHLMTRSRFQEHCNTIKSDYTTVGWFHFKSTPYIACTKWRIPVYVCVAALWTTTYSGKTLTDSSLYTCDQIETAAHFLLYCPLYNRQRQLFFTTFHVHQQ